jgi:hypothetical protein
MASELDEFYSGGPRTFAEAFPPVCIRSHWDPTMITARVLPQAGMQANLALDPRESFRICTQYFTASAGDAPLAAAPVPPPPAIPAELRGGPHRPMTGHGFFYPPGGAASTGFPYKGFHSDTESDILRLDEPLTKCAEMRYMPRNGFPAPTMGTNTITGIDQRPAMDSHLLNTGTLAGCREADDRAAAERSSRLFFNPTRYDRTIGVPKNLRRAESQGAVPAPLNAHL